MANCGYIFQNATIEVRDAGDTVQVIDADGAITDLQAGPFDANGNRERIEIQNRVGTCVALGKRVDPDISITFIDKGFGGVGTPTLSDAFLKQGDFVAATSGLGTGSCAPWAFDLEVERENCDDGSTEIWTYGNIEGQLQQVYGQPGTWQFTGKIRGAVTAAGNTILAAP